MTDEKSREEIIEDIENVLISAGAGSGKTSILVRKINWDLTNNATHYKIAAITFTKKAAKEIKDRLGGKAIGSFVGTNDSFVEQEIIRPFIRDALGSSYNDNFDVEYSKNKFDTSEEGLSILRNQNILSAFNDNKKNFKFQLALRILESSKAARQYLCAKFFKVFIDEYQDCDKDMHRLFMYLKDELRIKLFIVGDPKQSIYIWRGAAPEYFKGLISNPNDFNVYSLTNNFRCCSDIQNYSNLFYEETRHLFSERECVENVIGINDLGPISDILDNLTSNSNLLNIEEEIAILVRTNNQAQAILNELNECGYNFTYIPKTPLDNGTRNVVLLIELAKYAKNDRYSIYDVISELAGEYSSADVKEINDIIKVLKEQNIDEEQITKVLTELFYKLNIPMDINEVESFIEVIRVSDYDIAFDGSTHNHKIMTVHSSKGLEFKQVILFASDYRIYWNRDVNEHYVATTRGEEKMIVILDDNKYINHLQQLKGLCNLDSIEKVIKII